MMVQVVVQEWICLTLLLSSVHARLGSFYGDSFVFEALDSSLEQDTTTISLRFLTSSLDGVLFLALGTSQYVIVELLNGRLEMRIDLGYGEEVLSTTEDESLNNLIWHEFKVVRSGGNIKIVLNQDDVASSQIPVPNYEQAKLRLNFGAFVGGIAGNVTLPDGTRPSRFFRGCMLEAEINGNDLLSTLRSDKKNRIVYNVLAGCPKIVRSSRPESISFDSPSAYTALRRWTTQDEGTFECMIRTYGTSGIILYNAGRGRGEFIGLEMVDGVIGASVNKGGGVIGLHTTTPVNDGSWHTIKFGFSPSYLDIRVDGRRTKAFIEQTLPGLGTASISVQHRNLDLTGHLYIGGVPDSLSRDKAIPHSLISLGGSEGKATIGGAFPGCMKNIGINHRRKEFADFLISSKISTGCSAASGFSEDGSLATSNFQSVSNLISDLFAAYSLKENQHLKPIPTERTTTAIPITTAQQILLPPLEITTKPLTVFEGGFAVLSNQELSFSTIATIDISFVMSAMPAHGHLTKSNTCDDQETILEFTSEDVVSKSIRYCHDGSETLSDGLNFTVIWNLAHKNTQEKKEIISSLVPEVEFLSTGIVLNHGETYSVTLPVTAVDDTPNLHIPADYLYRPVKSVANHLPRSVLNATDPDSGAEDILYTILGNGRDEEFHLENVESSEQPITEFTQADVDENKIVFIHSGNRDNTRLFLRVSNLGMDNIASGQSHTNVLRIAAVPLNISVMVKKITLLEKSAFIITNEHVSVTSNAEPGAVMYVCKVLEQPSLGKIEVMQSSSNGVWIETSNFTIDQVNNGHVRYRNTERTQSQATVDQDSFKFSVYGAGITFEPHNFLINIKRVDVSFSLEDVLLENGVQEKLISGYNFNASVTHLTVMSSRIQVQLQKTPQHVQIVYNDNGLVLDANDTFTLEEAHTGRVSVRVKQKYSSQTFQEMIPLLVVVNNLYRSSSERLNVAYVPDLDRVLLINKGLELSEGQDQVISVRLLKASLPPSPVNDKIKFFHFNISRSPVHGLLRFINEEKTSEETEINSANGITEFLSSDLERGKLYYRHDDSETISDYFSIHVTPILEGQLPRTRAKLSAVYLKANVSIKIRLVNDQRPERIVNRPFEIARNTERLLTKDDLWYHDADFDYDDLDLTISRRGRGIINGDILNATNRRHEKIFRFTQRQIVNGEVLIKHEGEDFGRFVFWVRDGKHYATGLFSISASDPFLNIVNASRLLVVKGSYAVISVQNLWCRTNVEGLQKNIIYEVTKGPRNGLLYLNNSASHGGQNTQAASTFTQQDLTDRLLIYEHSGSPILDDAFHFRVSAGDIFTDGNLTVKVFLESHNKPPTVQKNSTIVLAQGQRIQIRKQNLRVVHPDTRANDIVFTITQYPSMGNLEYMSDVESEEFNSEPLIEFTQADINHGLVWYAQSESFRYSEDDFVTGLLLDHFMFSVTNKIISVANLSFFFDIVPNKIPLRLSNFSVAEGRSRAIIPEYLYIEGPYFDESEVEIRITSQPSHGILESQIGVALESFSYKLVTAEFLYYAHDGSDFLQDNFSLQAFTLNDKKLSRIVTAYVFVIPENDEGPIMVNNTGLNMWINSMYAISSSSLAFVDMDTAAGGVNFRILPPSNGWLAVKSDPSTAILNFTQAQIDKEEIVFVHKGPTTGGFTFQADDGVNYATKGIFVVTAKPLILSVKTTGTVEAFPGRSTPVSSTILQLRTNDLEFPNRTITYIITSQPKYGKLITKLKKDPELGPSARIKLDNFTQNDIDDDMVLFEQNVEIEEWSQVDSFVITASSPPAEEISDIKILVNITYDAIDAIGKQSPIEINKGFSVTEGGNFLVNTTILDASNLFKKLPLHRDRKPYRLIYSVTKVPMHGNLSVTGKNITKESSTFTQIQLQSDKIVYVHDHSDTYKDAFSFDVYLSDKRFSSSNGKPWIVPGTYFRDTFNITVKSLNDNPPKLLTKGNVLKVVNGFESPILPEVLKAVDPDNSPDEVSYSVIRPPSRGKIVFLVDRTNAITKFTQDDVDRGNVLFIPHHFNITKPFLEDAFYYGLTDGIQRTSYNFLQIKIVPVHVHFTSGTLKITQGSYSAVLSPTVLNVSTNGNYSLLNFEVSKPAQTGVILVNEEESDTFSFTQLSEQQVEFAMTDNSRSNDWLSIRVVYCKRIGANISTFAPVEIAFMPLLMQGILGASFDGLTRIGLGVLNASSLFEKTHSMPIFEITKMPAFGVILKVTLPEGRFKRDIDNLPQFLIETDAFTHEDVSLGHVFLYTENVNISDEMVCDDIGFRLKVIDGSTQPADFTFHYNITEVEPEDFTSFFRQFMPSVREETTVSDVEAADVMPTTSTLVLDTALLPQFQPSNLSIDQTGNHDDSRPVGNAIDPEDSISEDPKPAEAGVSWLIPAAVVIGLIIILAISLAVIFTKRKHWCKKKKYCGKAEKDSDENRSLTVQDSVQGKSTDPPMTKQGDLPSGELLRSPACPGVTVTLLKSEPRFEFSDSVRQSLDGREEMNSFHMGETIMPTHQSFEDDPSTAYAPSTVYHYDDIGSVDYPDAPEVEFYVANRGSYSGERLYHARSAKLLDPDVLALYSSDESIPSIIDEKYAISIKGVTGSMPSGLHRTISQPGTSGAGMATSRSTASLSKIAVPPELSLLPNSGLETNQYWI